MPLTTSNSTGVLERTEEIAEAPERPAPAAAGRGENLTRSFGWYGLAGILGSLAPFLLIPTYVRAMSPVQYGQFELVAVLVGLSTIAGSLGLSTGVFRFFSLARDLEERKQVVGAVLALALISASVGTLGFWAASFLCRYLTTGSPGLQSALPYLRLGGLLYATSLLQPLGWALLRAKQQSSRFALLSAISTCGLVVVVLLTIHRGPDPVSTVLLAQIGVGVLVCAVLAMWNTDVLAVRWDIKRLREVLGFSLPLMPAMLLIWVLDVSDRTLLAQFRGVEAVAIYTLGYKLGYILNLVNGAFTLAWVPHLLKVHGSPGADRALGRVVASYFGVLLLGAMVLSAAVPFALNWLAPAFYRPAADLVLPVALGYALNGMYAVATSGVHLSGNSRVLLKPLGAAAALNLLLNVVLIPRLGALGAAWSTLAAFAVAAVISLALVRKHLSIWVDPLQVSILGTACGAAVLLAALQPLLPRFISLALHALLLIMGGVAVYRNFRPKPSSP